MKRRKDRPPPWTCRLYGEMNSLLDPWAWHGSSSCTVKKTNRNSVKFIKSAVFSNDYPIDNRPEVAVAGRSNAGKSSFLNRWTGLQIAKVSGTPGKTRLLNFFDVDDKYRLVDMPGYGFAQRKNDEISDWKMMVEDYLRSRQSLRGVILLADARRDWGIEESQVRNYVLSQGLSFLLVLTKWDKLNQKERNERKKAYHSIEKAMPVFAVSNHSGEGIDDVVRFVLHNWVEESST